VCAAIMDISKLEDHRIVSDLEADINWVNEVRRVRPFTDEVEQVADSLIQHENVEQISEPPDQHI